MSLPKPSVALFAAILVASLSGCGGATQNDPSSSGGASSGGAGNGGAGNGGASNGGAGMTGLGGNDSSGGGTPGLGGAMPGLGGAMPGLGGATSGGAPSSGGTMMGFGGAASGGAPNTDICNLPWADGTCLAAFRVYWHNPATGLCEPRTYGGCGGNANRFETFEECQASCQPKDDPKTACNAPTDCELRSPSCCGACEPLEATDLVAMNRSAARQTCQVACGACLSPVANESTGRYFVPGCVDHRCTVIDIRETKVTECASTSDCALRNTARCCEACGASGDPIAFNKSINLVAEFCGGLAQPCPACIGGVAPGYTTECRNGRCTVDLTQ